MTDPLVVLDLCAGLESWAKPLRAAGHTVVTLDYDGTFGTTVTADVRAVTAAQLGGRGAYDAVVGSPPCEGFSVGSIGRHWNLDDGVATPKSDGARLGVEIAIACVDLVDALAPPLGFLFENPTGMMRHLLGFDTGARGGLEWRRWRHADDVDNLRAPSVTYCTLGLDYRKPTDLWVGGPVADHLDLPAPCQTDRNASVTVADGRTFRVNRRTGKPCHEVAERGARTGIQGIGSYAERSIIPADLTARLTAALEATPGPRVGRAPDLDPAIRGHRQTNLFADL